MPSRMAVCADRRYWYAGAVRGYEVVLDARALLLRTGPVDVLRDQALSLAERARRPRLDLRIIPIGAESSVSSTVGFAIYEFRAAQSPDVTWVESLAGDTYFAAPEDVALYTTAFEGLQGIALNGEESISYLRWFAEDVDRFLVRPRHEEAVEDVSPT